MACLSAVANRHGQVGFAGRNPCRVHRVWRRVEHGLERRDPLDVSRVGVRFRSTASSAHPKGPSIKAASRGGSHTLGAGRRSVSACRASTDGHASDTWPSRPRPDGTEDRGVAATRGPRTPAGPRPCIGIVARTDPGGPKAGREGRIGRTGTRKSTRYRVAGRARWRWPWPFPARGSWRRPSRARRAVLRMSSGRPRSRGANSGRRRGDVSRARTRRRRGSERVHSTSSGRRSQERGRAMTRAPGFPGSLAVLAAVVLSAAVAAPQELATAEQEAFAAVSRAVSALERADERSALIPAARRWRPPWTAPGTRSPLPTVPARSPPRGTEPPIGPRWRPRSPAATGTRARTAGSTASRVWPTHWCGTSSSSPRCRSPTPPAWRRRALPAPARRGRGAHASGGWQPACAMWTRPRPWTAGTPCSVTSRTRSRSPAGFTGGRASQAHAAAKRTPADHADRVPEAVDAAATRGPAGDAALRASLILGASRPPFWTHGSVSSPVIAPIAGAIVSCQNAAMMRQMLLHVMASVAVVVLCATPAQAQRPSFCDQAWASDFRILPTYAPQALALVRSGADVNEECTLFVTRFGEFPDVDGRYPERRYTSSPRLVRLAIDALSVDLLRAVVNAGANVFRLDGTILQQTPVETIERNIEYYERRGDTQAVRIMREMRAILTGGMDAPDASMEAHAKLCDLNWWRSSASGPAVEELLRIPGVDPNTVCNLSNDRPIHLPLKLTSFVMLTENVDNGIDALVDGNADLRVTNSSGDSAVKLVGIRYDRVRDRIVQHTGRWCRGEMNSRQFGDEIVRNRPDTGTYLRVTAHATAQPRHAINERIFMELYRVRVGGRVTKDVLCSYRGFPTP